MTHIPEGFIEDLLLRVDLVGLVSKRLKLKKTGANYSACCPFHKEKTPSFTVSPSKQFYHCFGCGVSGDAINFVRQLDGLDFVDAVQKIARDHGITVPVQSDPEEGRLQPLYSVLKAASQFFIKQLAYYPEAQEYLQKRGFTAATVQQFGIGYAPDKWDELLKNLGRDPQEQSLLEQAGLLIAKEQGYYDRFRGRVIFPIQDKRGRVVGFGGRIMGEGQPKYLNSPETPLFHKGSLLFGIHQVLLHKRHLKELVVVEGYADCVMLDQAGYKGVVATLGTALTIEQIKLLFQIHSQLVFCFDGDPAGVAASEKALRTVLPWIQDGRSVRFAFLPEGEDPDSLVREQGTTAFNKILEQAIPLSAFFFQYLQKTVQPTTIDARAQLVNLAKPMLLELPKGVFRELMFDQLAKLVGMEKNVLEGRREERPPPRRQTAVAHQQPPHAARLALALLHRYPELGSELNEVSWLAGLSGKEVSLLSEYIAFLQKRGPAPANTLGAAEETWVAMVPAAGAKRELEDIFLRLKEQGYQNELDQLLLKAKQIPLNEAEKQRVKSLLTQMAVH